jgi:hypothetical protein
MPLRNQCVVEDGSVLHNVYNRDLPAHVVDSLHMCLHMRDKHMLYISQADWVSLNLMTGFHRKRARSICGVHFLAGAVKEDYEAGPKKLEPLLLSWHPI